MATTVIKTIKPSGGDYTSLSAWEAANQGNLVTADEKRVAECYSMIDSAQCTVDGSTTNTTCYLEIYTPTSERHNGTRSPSKYLMEANFGSFTPALSIQDDYTRVQGLQFHGTGSSAGIQTTNCSNVRISDCLSYDCGSEGVLIYQSSSAITLMNVVSLHCNRGFHYYNATTINSLNCVAMGSTERGFWQENQIGNTYKNCYSGGSVGADWDVPASNNWTTNFSEDGTGTTTTAAYSSSSGAYLTNVTVGSEDPHIGALSTLKDAGTDLSGDAAWIHPNGNVDIIGTTRPQGSTWDVGVFESVPTSKLQLAKRMPLGV